MARLLPTWLRRYHRHKLNGDLLAALVVATLLVPQAMAYAALAGLPPHVGLYASVLPLIAYALAGSSSALAVGPVAVIALMTATALQGVAEPGSSAYVAAAATLALLSGAMLFLAGLLRLGALANFLSQPVIAGFTSGAAILILVSQLGPLLGLEMEKGSAAIMVADMLRHLGELDVLTALIGFGSLILLLGGRKVIPLFFKLAGASRQTGALVSKLLPMAVIIAATLLVAFLGLDREGVAVAGELPSGLPKLALPTHEWSIVSALLLPALLISLLGFMESVSVGSAVARKRRESVDPDAELRGLGLANLSGGLSSAMPVSGGFSRTAVNAEAGANSPLAGIFVAVLIALVLLFATKLFAALPMAALAALIIVAVTSLIDIRGLRQLWRYDRADALAMGATAAGVILLGVEPGIATGVVFSLGIVIWRSSRPHIAVVGQVPGTEHFRNVRRHRVNTHPDVLMLRVDENLFFGNAQAVERSIHQTLNNQDPMPRQLVLILMSVSHIDATALEMLEALDESLSEQGIQLHLAEVKGPVMDRLQTTGFIRRLSGKVWLSSQEAFSQLKTGPATLQRQS